jgi:nucleotide-binding universal stress UspA family protein
MVGDHQSALFGPSGQPALGLPADIASPHRARFGQQTGGRNEVCDGDLVVIGHLHASRLESALLGSACVSAVREG